MNQLSRTQRSLARSWRGVAQEFWVRERAASLPGALGLLSSSGEARPSVLAPSASRLAVAVTASGAMCVQYNGRPFAVAASAATWADQIARKLEKRDAASTCERVVAAESGMPS